MNSTEPRLNSEMSLVGIDTSKVLPLTGDSKKWMIRSQDGIRGTLIRGTAVVQLWNWSEFTTAVF